MKTGSLYIISTAVTIALAALPALADYHYASHEGSNTPPYNSWATAADSIQKAIDAATAGDTIYVGAGVWSEEDTLDFYKSLIGKGIDSSIFYIPGFTGSQYIWVFSGSTIEGFTLRGDNIVNSCGVGGDALDSLITIKNNKFERLGYALAGSIGGTILNNIFENNVWCGVCVDIVRNFDIVVKNNTFANDSMYHLGLYKGKNIVTNNLFLHFGEDGLHFTSFTGDSIYFANNIMYKTKNNRVLGVHIRVGGPFTCNNNIFIGPDSANPGQIGNVGIMGTPLTNGSMNIINSIFIGFNTALYLYGHGELLGTSYNDLWHNEEDFSLTDINVDTTGIVHADPMFSDTTAFQLQMFSPLIDAGDPAILDEDSSRLDIGAWGGPYGHSYQYIDYPPQVPSNLHGQLVGDTIKLNWKYNTEADFNHYSLFRDTLPGFTPSGLNLIAEPETSLYSDVDFEANHTYYYKISATDNQNNISDYSIELLVYVSSIDGNDNLPVLSSLGIKNTFPNPFNSSMKIEYYLPDVGFQPASVQVNIYDVQGRIVKHLVDTRQYPGNHEILWDGRNDDKKEVNSGIYFVRLVFSGIELAKSKKITLTR